MQQTIDTEIILDAKTTAREFNNNLKRICREVLGLTVQVRVLNSYNWPMCRYVEVVSREVPFPNEVRKLAVLQEYGKLEGVANPDNISFGNINPHSITISPKRWNDLFVIYSESNPPKAKEDRDPARFNPEHPQIAQLAEALKKAVAAANEHATVEDTGTFNLDSVVIKLFRWKKSDIVKVKELSGILISEVLTGFWAGYRFVYIPSGKANRRAAMMQAAYESLKADGYDVHLYQQGD